MPFIQLRRGAAIPADEMHLVGEAIWDDVNSRLGVFNNRAPTAVEWYPQVIGNKLMLNPDQTLGGKLADGQENNVYLDWATQDSLILRNRNNGMVYATFNAAGATFNAVAGVGTPYLGLTNLLVNGSLAVKRGAIATALIDNATAAYRSYLFAPNWQLWKTAGTSGRMTLTYGALSNIPFAGCQGVLQLAASGAPNSSGLRTFLYGYEAIRGLPVTFSSYVWGAAGATTTQRAVTQNGNVLFSKTVTGTGAWQRVVSTVTPPNDGSYWAGYDVLYNPSGNSNSNQTWLVAGAQLQFGNGISVFENRPEGMERALCDSIYREGRVRLVNATDVATVDLNNFQAGVMVEAVEDAAKAVTISNKDAYGFNLQVPSLTSASMVKYAAYMMPTTGETA